MLVASLLRIYHALSPSRLKLFEGLTLFVPRGVFDPSISVSTALMISTLKELRNALHRDRGVAIDHGCGSGAIGIFIAKFLGFKEVHLVDVDPLALATSRINARLNGVSDKVRILDRVPKGARYDLAVTNPPYLPLDPRNERDKAWCGGRGLRIYRRMVMECLSRLRKGGVLLTSLSSLSLGALEFLERICDEITLLKYTRTPFDTVYVFACVRS